MKHLINLSCEHKKKDGILQNVVITRVLSDRVAPLSFILCFSFWVFV